VLVDDGGVDVGDLGALGETVDDERVQRVGVLDANVQQEVLLAGDDEDAISSGRPAAQSRNASMFSRDGGRMRTAISACTSRPSASSATSCSARSEPRACAQPSAVRRTGYRRAGGPRGAESASSGGLMPLDGRAAELRGRRRVL
jgi:hypothetical protein